MVERRRAIAEQDILNDQVPVLPGGRVIFVLPMIFMSRYQPVQETIQQEKFLLEGNFKNLLKDLPLNIIGDVVVGMALPAQRILREISEIDRLQYKE
jgi:hypothetical protein